jgi:hypothetical protein
LCRANNAAAVASLLGPHVAAASLCRVVDVSSPFVWRTGGRAIGSLKQFAALAFSLYGIVCDLGPKQLRTVAAANIKECLVERRRAMVRVAVDGPQPLHRALCFVAMLAASLLRRVPSSAEPLWHTPGVVYVSVTAPRVGLCDDCVLAAVCMLQCVKPGSKRALLVIDVQVRRVRCQVLLA